MQASLRPLGPVGRWRVEVTGRVPEQESGATTGKSPPSSSTKPRANLRDGENHRAILPEPDLAVLGPVGLKGAPSTSGHLFSELTQSAVYRSSNKHHQLRTTDSHLTVWRPQVRGPDPGGAELPPTPPSGSFFQVWGWLATPGAPSLWIRPSPAPTTTRVSASPRLFSSECWSHRTRAARKTSPPAVSFHQGQLRRHRGLGLQLISWWGARQPLTHTTATFTFTIRTALWAFLLLPKEVR